MSMFQMRFFLRSERERRQSHCDVKFDSKLPNFEIFRQSLPLGLLDPGPYLIEVSTNMGNKSVTCFISLIWVLERP